MPIVSPAQISSKIPTVNVGVPDSELPPYFFYAGRFTPGRGEEARQDDGIEQNIIQLAFENAGYQPEFSYLKTRHQDFQKANSTVDCISSVTEGENLSGYYSDPVIDYRDTVIFLTDTNPPITTLDDLIGQPMETFYQASKYHPELIELSKNPLYYHEHRSKISQVILLYRRKVKALVMDKYSFYFARYRANLVVDTSPKCEMRNWLNSQPYRMLCRDEQMRNQFNQGLKKLHENQEYETIIQSYMNRYSQKGSVCNIQ